MSFTINQITSRAFDVIKEREAKGIFPLIDRRFYFKLDRCCIIGTPRFQSSFYPSKKCKP